MKNGTENAGGSAFSIDIHWVLDRLLKDGLLSEADPRFVASRGREKGEIHWNPLRLVAKYDLTDCSDAEGKKKLTLDRLTEWLAKKAL